MLQDLSRNSGSRIQIFFEFVVRYVARQRAPRFMRSMRKPSMTDSESDGIDPRSSVANSTATATSSALLEDS